MTLTTATPDFTRLAPKAGTRVAIVGGCGGIGRALIVACLEADLRVVNLDLARSIDERPAPQGTTSIALDATDEDNVRTAFARAGEELGGLDALVHLAGFTDDPTRIDDMATERWEEMISVNLKSAFLCARAALPLLRQDGGGTIVNTASGLAVLAPPGFAAYSASKAGVIALTKALANENAPAVRANAVAPGPVDTAFLSGGTGRGGKDGDRGWFAAFSEKAGIEKSIPMGRIAVADDVVGPMLFLMGDAARYMTGQVLYINGGRLMP